MIMMIIKLASNTKFYGLKNISYAKFFKSKACGDTIEIERAIIKF